MRGPALAAALSVAPIGAMAVEGAALFKQHCAPCHQETAVGTVGLAPSLHGGHWQRLGAQRSYLPTVLLKGLAGPIKVGDAAFNGSMPAFAPQLPDADLAAVATHLRSLQGAAGEAAFGAEEFAAVRAQAGSPSQTRTLRRQILGD